MTLGASPSAHPRLLHAAWDLMGVLLAILVVIAGSFVGIAPAIATPSTSSTYTYDGSGSGSRAQALAGLSERIASSFREGDSRAGGTSAVRGDFAVAANTAADDWPVISGIVRDAAKGKGNYGLGSGTVSQAERAGQTWVGDGYKVASDGKTLVSQDGLRQFRPPSYKPSLDSWQANFEQRWTPEGQWQGNGHFDITDIP